MFKKKRYKKEFEEIKIEIGRVYPTYGQLEQGGGAGNTIPWLVSGFKGVCLIINKYLSHTFVL